MNHMTRYYNMKTRNERHINPFELKNIEKQYIENYSKLANFNRKGFFNKLKYRYPSLEKFQYNLPQSFIIDLNSPIYEDTHFFKKKNLNLSVSMKNVAINKENMKNKYQRVPPSFTIPNKNKMIEQLREEYKDEVKRLEKNYNIFRKEIKQKGGDTTEKFFSSISKSI